MKYLIYAAITSLLPLTAFAEPPRVVELFTSEGCSSCPPADAVLNDIAAREDIIALAWHVDYWNRLGWTDPFSDPRWSARQQEFAMAFQLSSMYTPQMIVDGTTQFVGSDKGKLNRALKNDAPESPITISVDAPAIEGDTAKANVLLEGINEAEDVRIFALMTENDLTTKSIPRGENHGRTLHHNGVVREMVELKLEGEQELSIAIDKKWKKENLNLVIIAQSKTMKILGATKGTL